MQVLTFRTDTLHTQGSNTPVLALATILQAKASLHRQRTLCSHTSSLKTHYTLNYTWSKAMSTSYSNRSHIMFHKHDKFMYKCTEREVLTDINVLFEQGKSSEDYINTYIHVL